MLYYNPWYSELVADGVMTFGDDIHKFTGFPPHI